MGGGWTKGFLVGQVGWEDELRHHYGIMITRTPSDRRVCDSPSFFAPTRIVKMASLFVIRGRDQGKHFTIESGNYLIGREASSDIHLLDTESSRKHAELRVQSDGEIVLVDLKSSNGTEINGQRIDTATLRSGDRIEIGSTLLIFTGTSTPSVMEAAHGIDIVHQTLDDGSRIVSSLPQSNSLDTNAFHKTAPAQKPHESSESDRSLEVMYLTAIAVGRTDDLNEVLNRVLRLVFDWVEADRGCVMLQDPDSGELQPAARCDRDRSENSDHKTPISISHTILDYVLEHQKGVRTSDAKDDTRFDSAASIVTSGIREALCVPLQGRYGIVGAMYIDTYTAPGELLSQGATQRFNDEHLKLITAIGHQAALAIEDTTYYSALVQSERLAAMGQTIATISHHIKNILQGISGGGYLIEAGLKRDDNEAIRRGWAMVERNQDRISHLVMDMLTFSKEREPDKVPVDLNGLIDEVIELMQSPAEQRGVQLGSNLTHDMPMPRLDPDAVHRALLNLISNAVDAAASEEQNAEASDSPKVFVQSLFDSQTGWMIDVIDNGPGIAPQDRAKVFSLFESSKGMRGTGLGLPVTAKIMREHGGSIEIRDSDVVRGAHFRMNFPLDELPSSELANRETMGQSELPDNEESSGAASP